MNAFQHCTLVALLHVAGISGLSALASGAALAADAPASGLDLPYFDRKVRVQDDLFRATNGGWIKATTIPADKGSWGSFEKLAELSDQRVRALAEGLAAQPQSEGSKEAKIGQFYAAFLDTARIDREGLSALQPRLDEIAALVSREQLLVWLGSAQGQLRQPFRLGLGPDPKEPMVNRLQLAQSGLGLPERDYYLNQRDPSLAKARSAYLAYLSKLARLSGEAQPAEAARRVLALETRMAKAHWDVVSSRDVQKTYNPMTPAELSAAAPGLDWNAFFAAAQLKAVDKLTVAQPSAIRGLAQLLAEVPLADWKLYAKLHTLDAHAAVLPQPFRAAAFAFHGRAMSGTQQELPRWKQGVDAINEALGEAVGELYVAQHFPPAQKARMQELVANLLAAYKSSVDGLSWMTPETKLQAQDKLSKYLVKIGYPDVWRDYSALQVKAGDAIGNQQRAAQFAWAREAAKLGQKVDRSEWGMVPQQVNAYYNETFNEVVFPAAILQPPFFDMKADDAVNYGGIGAVIGHEISHGFDDQGAQYDGDGMLRDWWQPADRKAFEALGQRLAQQFSAYQALPGKRVNGQLTLGENIADLSGLQIAYKAYQASLGGKPAPVLDGYTGEQRFFLGFAQIWREKVRPPLLLQQLMADPHSPGQFRANGGVVNHDAFHQAFGTRKGDRLFKPEGERIRIW
ncbi:M13 family metallopeptidase [Kinneretia aquatilis]|uniref:M13 family metallopeptidase n=1 Tax=Kinneretia aquatilis TaxID=2070761 RepID=UPI00149524D9|nr:M13 family metallopeptidase [Paucibacter aquatile]WIV99551.1 M13 family metallopeptidase [Paucibacter aquatile]